MNWSEKITDFSNFLKFEKSFSDNTLDAYVRDIKKLESFATTELQEVSPQNISYEDLQEFIYQLSKKKISERSQARGISSIKAFFQISFGRRVQRRQSFFPFRRSEIGSLSP